MISGKIKNAIYSKKIRNAIKSRSRSGKSSSGKLGIITDAEDTETIKTLADIPKKLGFKTLEFNFVLCDAEAELIPGLEYITLNPKEISASGVFRSESVEEFAKGEFDLLICYFKEKQPAGTMLATKVKAGHIFGNTPDRFGAYDVEINTDNIGDFQQEVIKYYKIFKTK